MGLVDRKISENVERLPYLGVVEDADGDEVDAWGDPVELGIFGFDPGGSFEPLLAGHDRVVTEPTIFLPPGSPFAPFDKCVVRGKEYTVEGETADWVHPKYGPMGDVVKLKRVTG